ncbi:MAG: aconitate hydratase, partial [Alphaproteobacteria bacterium]|nr:aconitate hydratase [Alphaproteobacteria bacterium]
VAFGCTTCIGNSGPLLEPIAEAIDKGNITVGSVLSGNRNFEGRVHPQVKANYLASPPLVVAYAIAGSLKVNVATDSLGKDQDGNDVYLKDIWPSNAEVQAALREHLTQQMFEERYANVLQGPKEWQAIKVSGGETYQWNSGSTYVQNPPYFEGMTAEPGAVSNIVGARPLAVLGDSITTDHISPAGSIARNGPAGEYLTEHQVRPVDFNSYGARRGNHQVMMRGTFANIRIRNQMAPGTEGGVTKHLPSGEVMSMYDASQRYQAEGVPLVVIGGKEYGTGSSRDWAAKGTYLLGIRAVITESFERIHRSNLVGMGVLPLVFQNGQSRESLKLDGSETFDISGVTELKPRMEMDCTIHRADGSSEQIKLLCRIDTLDEVDYYKNGGILQYVLRNMMKAG